jgi:hypothetical protein
MLFKRISFFLVATMVVMAGCKPAPKSLRASAERPAQTATPVQSPAPSLKPAAAEQPAPQPAPPPPTPKPQPVAVTIPAAEPNKSPMQPGPAPLPVNRKPADPNVADSNKPTVSAAGDNTEPNDIRNSFNAKFEPILNIYVGLDGKVDYTKLRRMRLIFAPLLQDIDGLSAKEYDSWSANEKIAFWINTYNLCTLKVVADNYPVKASPYKMLFYPASSIMHIDRAWTDYKFSVMGVSYSLTEIEQRILLNQFDEPRIAFALSYASQWSPRLRNKPYYGTRLDRQLDEQTREFIASEKGFRIDKNGDTVYLSIVFKETRFQPGFVEKHGSDRRFNDDRPEIRAMLSFVSTYLDRADVDYLAGKKYTVSYAKPDWSFNE